MPPLFTKAYDYLVLKELDLHPPASTFTAREIEAIKFIHGYTHKLDENHRKELERLKGRGRNHS